MAVSMYQGLQSCLEPRVIESRVNEPRVLWIKLARSNLSCKECPDNDDPNTEIKCPDCETKRVPKKTEGGWSFLQSLTDSTREAIDDVTKVYVHPKSKSSFSSSTLNKESLEMCTESLGSESGSDNGSDYDNCTPRTSFSQKNKTIMKSQSQRPRRSFPPPLTSISSSNGVKVLPRREGGRLVLKAVKVSMTQTCFRAERSEGRLRIILLKNYDSPPTTAEVTAEVTAEEEFEIKAESEEEEEGKDWDEGNNDNMVPAVRPSRCGGHGNNNKSMLDWEPFLVAT